MLPKIDPGELRHQITIQQWSSVRSAIGEASDSFSDYKADIWAKIESAGANEFYRSRKLQGEGSHVVTIRYDDAPSTEIKMQVVFGSRNFDIQGVLNVEERNVWLVLLCRELIQS
jgi:SPP1 family predicted phage head-tail adaptor